MKTIAEYKDLQVPCWALSYIVNGDDSGIDESEKAQVDSFMRQFDAEAQKINGSVLFSTDDEEGHFTHNPEFGLACDCEDCTVLIVK